MNWDTHFSSILSAADGSVAKMRERLTASAKAAEVVFPPSDASRGVNLGAPCLSRAPLAPGPAVQWSDIAALHAQFQSQSQAIESLTQALHSMERERDSQQRQLQALQEELQKLRECGAGKVWPRLGEEQWKREVGRELSSLRGRMDMAASLGSQEESFGSRLQREEMERLRREVDQLKQQLRRQEQDLSDQQAESRDARRHYERNCKTLESLADNYRSHTLDLSRTMSEYQHAHQDVQQLKLAVSELRGWILGEGRDPPACTARRADQKFPGRPPSGYRERPALDSEEESSPTPSLGDVSSDELSWSEDLETAPRRKHPGSFPLSESQSSETGSGPEEPPARSDELEEELLSELSVSDL
ncbi:uncharacterized protein LOC125709316 [Brienomyrus brachyistius]|uniref:uncharacterized protein LOC125709316 n=1 Tax=Brienomyrus brachyistius TaxID=42636 RepID=UPI0020B38545|nr:uncharacterized protein LOC125709316 [Brienomyrus brachyistius]XP_048833586.1 uncharacterized protein LOC125709316 [Brienomyrus brachyistius]